MFRNTFQGYICIAHVSKLDRRTMHFVTEVLLTNAVASPHCKSLITVVKSEGKTWETHLRSSAQKNLQNPKLVLTPPHELVL